MKRLIRKYLAREDGAITVDFVVLTALIVLLVLGVVTVIVSEGVLQGTYIAELVARALRS